MNIFYYLYNESQQNNSLEILTIFITIKNIFHMKLFLLEWSVYLFFLKEIHINNVAFKVLLCKWVVKHLIWINKTSYLDTEWMTSCTCCPPDTCWNWEGVGDRNFLKGPGKASSLVLYRSPLCIFLCQYCWDRYTSHNLVAPSNDYRYSSLSNFQLYKKTHVAIHYHM